MMAISSIRYSERHRETAQGDTVASQCSMILSAVLECMVRAVIPGLGSMQKIENHGDNGSNLVYN